MEPSQYPLFEEENDMMYSEFPVYRGVAIAAPTCIDDIYAQSDLSSLPVMDFMTEMPTLRKHTEKLAGNEPKFSYDSESDDMLLLSQLQPNDIQSSDADMERIGTFSPTQLPLYDATDLYPLEHTHISIRCDELGKEEIFINAISAYLNDYQDQLAYSTVDDSVLPIYDEKRGFYKCSVGRLNDDLSYEVDYCCFAVQIYLDANDSSNVIIEWQRRRGNRRVFTQLYDHFKNAIQGYVNAIQGSQGSVSAPMKHLHSVSEIISVPAHISPTAPSEMFGLIS